MTQPDRRRWSWKGLLRPLLTVILTMGLFLGSLWLVGMKMLAAEVWFSAWMGIVTSIVSYLFGERAALKQRDSETP